MLGAVDAPTHLHVPPPFPTQAPSHQRPRPLGRGFCNPTHPTPNAPTWMRPRTGLPSVGTMNCWSACTMPYPSARPYWSCRRHQRVCVCGGGGGSTLQERGAGQQGSNRERGSVLGGTGAGARVARPPPQHACVGG